MSEAGDEEVPGQPEEGEEKTKVVTFDKDMIEEFYQETLEPQQAVEFIAGKLGFTEYTTNVKESIQIEIYEQMLNYSKSCGFSIEQTTGFVGLFTKIIESMKDGNSKEGTESQTKDALTDMCNNIPNFNPTIVKFMLDFLARTVFQHYSLYSQVYQLPEREQDLVKVTLEVETARIPPLSRGELQVIEPEVEQEDEEDETEKAEAANDEEEANEQDVEDQEPNPVNDIIESEIARRVGAFKDRISKEYADREAALLQKLQEIEGKS